LFEEKSESERRFIDFADRSIELLIKTIVDEVVKQPIQNFDYCIDDAVLDKHPEYSAHIRLSISCSITPEQYTYYDRYQKALIRCMFPTKKVERLL